MTASIEISAPLVQLRMMIGDERSSAAVPRQEPGQAAAALAAAAAGGDRAAFALLYERFAPVVHGILLSRVASAHVDDLVQDVFVTALRRIGDLRDPAAFPGWIVAIARNRAADHHRGARRYVPMPEHLPAASRSDDGAAAEVVLGHLVGLPTGYRETLVLRLVEGLTGPEIAVRTGMTHGSVRVNLHRGMELLRRRLRGEGRR